MDIHNINEEVVFSSVQNIFDEIQNGGNQDGFCLCYQCRMDTICYTLNRIEPHYITSNRGLTRVEQLGTSRQQIEADITTLVYKGLRLVNHNRRPTSSHDSSNTPHHKVTHPVYDIPTIAGRLFDGISFEPVVGIDLALYCNGELVPMRNPNWQNPYTMVASTPGAFSFWPAPVIGDAPDATQIFKYSLRVNSPDYEPFNHFFNITSVSKFHTPQSYALNRTFKLPDLYIFPPGEAEQNG
ncbi:MAG: late competence development ComFB family protein [Treponema sp.]|jgi:competence protein ComFB|nr:late competence development ComFB family protein [Treponema sp.]